MPNQVTAELIGKKISFSSKNTTDTTVYVGTVTGIISYELARNFGDPDAYNRTIQLIDNTTKEASDLTYFAVSLEPQANGSTVSSVIAFANEWISDGTLKVIQNNVVVTIQVYDSPTNDHNEIVKLLRSAGFQGKIVSVE